MRTMNKDPGKVIWITGLSDSGKTTISKRISEELRKKNLNVILLDGDVLRGIFSNDYKVDSNFEKIKRIELAKNYSKLCKVLAEQGYIVVIATISMFSEIYKWNRINLPGYFEIYIKVPMEVLFNRDTKGLYKKFFEGNQKNIAGLDLEIDEPPSPNYVVKDYKGEIGSIAKDIIKKIF